MSQIKRHNDVAFGKQVSKLIQSRRTTKLLAKDGVEITFTDEEASRMDKAVIDSIQDAGYAPFHYDRGVDGIAEPWRFYFLKQKECRQIGRMMPAWFTDMRPTNKLPSMLRSCGSLILVTWLPQFDRQVADAKQLQIDQEHLAAAAAATQNLLLSLTSKNFKTYWSSGGLFREPKMFQELNIDLSEQLLAAVFVGYGADDEDVEVIYGKHHPSRSEHNAWTRVISF